MTLTPVRIEWDRARDAFRDTQILHSSGGFDGAASRAYYAAFHAVTTLFSVAGHSFTKHSALETAVHRDLVKTGRWPRSLGHDFSFCLELRGVSDYGTGVRIDAAQASEAIEAARRILLAVQSDLPEDFPRL
ncbi:MAG: HEPN domain-containing protein [Acidobacteria bacterium]|nr:HEPN domain-containing protein [Acidobacteriota bacterium]